MEERLNMKFLAYCLAIILVFGVGWHCVHAFQVHRTAASLIAYADRAEEEANANRAIGMLGRYLDLIPDDVEAKARFALLVDRQPLSARGRAGVIRNFEWVLLRAPARHDVRRHLVIRQVQMGQFDSALENLECLREAMPDDAELEFLTARCHEERSEYRRAVMMYEKAIAHDPAQLEAYQRLAMLLQHRLRDPESAERSIDAMVAKNVNSAKAYQAYLGRAKYFKDIPANSSKRRAQAAEDLARAVRLAPQDVNVYLAAGAIASDLNDVSSAREYLQSGIKRFPRDGRLYQMQSGIEALSGRPDQAIACLRQGLKTLPQDADLLGNLANLLLDRGDRPGAETLLLDLKKLPGARLEAEFLEARLLLAQSKWLEAARALEGLRPQMASSVQQVVGCDLVLAQCYEQLGDPERQLSALRRVLTVDPSNISARVGLAEAALRAGRADDALTGYRELTTLRHVPGFVWIGLTRQMILQNLSRPPEQQQWDKVEETLKKAAQENPNALIVELLRAEILVGRGKAEEARQVLDKARRRWPKDLDAWTTLANLEDMQGSWDKAVDILQEAGSHFGDTVQLRLAWLDLIPRHGADPRAKQFLARCTEGTDKFPAKDRARLLRGLAQAHGRLGLDSEARRAWQALAELMPNDLSAQSALFEQALLAKDKEGQGKAIETIGRIERGEGGLSALWKVRSLIQRGEEGERDSLVQARAELAKAASLRAGSWGVALCQARIEEIEGNTDRAIEAYQKAINAGDHRPYAVRRCIQLLYARERYVEAEQLILRLKDQMPVSSDLQKLAAEVSLRTLHVEDALKWAEKAVSTDSKNYSDLVWLAQILWSANKLPEAEHMLRRALELAKGVPQTWMALIQFQLRTGQTRQAKETIALAKQKLAPERAALGLAQCYELLKMKAEAETEYRLALLKTPTDPDVLRPVAEFYIRSRRFREAEPCLRKILDPSTRAPAPVLAWAGRTLATELALIGNYRQFKEALALLDASREKGLDSQEYKLARGLILATRPLYRRKAVDLLEKAFLVKPPTAGQRFLLAQLYDCYGDARKASEQFLLVLATEGDNQGYLAGYIRSQLRQGHLAEAASWSGKLQPGTPETVLLQVELLVRRMEVGPALGVITNFLSAHPAKKQEDLRIVQSMADLLERLAHEAIGPAQEDRLSTRRGQAPAEQPARPDSGDPGFSPTKKALLTEAQRLYRKLASEGKDPRWSLGLAGFLARQGKVIEALTLCESVWSKAPADSAAYASVSALAQSGCKDGSAFQQVEDRLRSALVKNPQNIALTGSLAILYEHQARYQEAENLYRQVIDRDPESVFALNNLAYLFALRGRHVEEGLALIERALELSGPTASLLDTRAMVYFASGSFDLAIADLKEALADEPTAARYLHLARVHQAMQNRRAAEEALQAARNLNRDSVRLHPLEESASRELMMSRL
jgi:tetratricopeptide (TPR) repeat protein